MSIYDPKICKKDLKHGQYYFGRCRNANEARWDGNINKFIYWRYKFGHMFLEEICCPEDDQRFDVFVTERELETPIKEIPLIGK